MVKHDATLALAIHQMAMYVIKGKMHLWNRASFSCDSSKTARADRRSVSLVSRHPSFLTNSEGQAGTPQRFLVQRCGINGASVAPSACMPAPKASIADRLL
jgi:hypothetical protein